LVSSTVPSGFGKEVEVVGGTFSWFELIKIRGEVIREDPG
jgi:hypothetical protein